MLSNFYITFRVQTLRFLAFSRGSGGFRELREAGRKHFHLSWYLVVPGVTSYGQNPSWGDFLNRPRWHANGLRYRYSRQSYNVFFWCGSSTVATKWFWPVKPRSTVLYGKKGLVFWGVPVYRHVFLSIFMHFPTCLLLVSFNPMNLFIKHIN